MYDKLNEIFRRIFQDDSINVTPEMNANDVDGWDSITHAEMIAEVEKAFGVKFKLREITRWKNVGDMVASLEKHGATA